MSLRLAAVAVLASVAACGSRAPAPQPPTPQPVRPSPAAPAAPETEAIASGTEAGPEEPADDALPTYVSPPDAPYRPPPGPPSTPAHVPGPTPEDEKECKARGGRIQAVCMLGSFECVIRYRDGGKRCTDKRDCTGECWYEGPRPIPAQAAGVCQRTSDPCGCHARVIGGKVQPTMCLD